MNGLTPTISLAELHRLKRCLPELVFDPSRDAAARDCPGFDDYLDYYDIDFSAEMANVRHAMGRLAAGDYEIATHYWLPPGRAGGTVVIVHGYFDHVGLFGRLIRYLLESNYVVVAFDLPGHGLSSGERASIESFDHYQQVLDAIITGARRSLPRPLSAVGQSTGGAILLKRVFEEGGEAFDHIALLAPLVEPAHWWFNRLLFRLVHRFRDSISRKFLINSGDREFTDFIAERDPLQSTEMPMQWIAAMREWIREFKAMPANDYPVRIVQGTRDTTLDWRYNLKVLARKFPQADIRRIEGAGHHLVNETPDLRRRVFAAMGL